MNNEPVTENERAALAAFQKMHGNGWKAQLRKSWMFAEYPTALSDWAGAQLQQIRNTRGPSWLASYRPPEED